ncbi:ABC transporter permease subunit [Bifidobacterium callitrichidarum]|uniref:ABC transporter permease subunit n=1 Tax=Bifidobacterium callitrichidarum TaxID=2052941 RepID=UPI0011B20300|nr:ABC transporter permease subunit [Bifidobacterium callitrichidarum]
MSTSSQPARHVRLRSETSVGLPAAGTEATNAPRIIIAMHPLRFTGTELIKIARLPLVWAIVAVFALVNLMLAATVPANTVALHNYASAVAVTIGGRTGPDFSRKLAQVDAGADESGRSTVNNVASGATTDATDAATAADASSTPEATDHNAIVITARIPTDSTLTNDELHRQLTAVTRGTTNTLATYDPAATRDAMLAQVAGDPVATWLMQRKYDAYATRVTHLTAAGAAMDLAAGTATDDTLLHWSRMTSYLFYETCVLAVLLMALALGSERTSGTEQLLMTTRTGRRLAAPKIAAGLIATTVAYLLLVAAIVVPYLMVFDVRGVWSASVSSQFNTVFGQQPFVTWWDLTIGQYLFVRLTLGLAVTLCFALFTAVLGLLIRNTFAVAGLVGMTVLLLTGLVGVAHSLGSPWLAWIGGFNPVGVLLLRNQWFTELGLDAPTAFWETGVTACSLVYLTAGVLLARHSFNCKDLK